jgi:hypothetical protein
MTDNRKEKLDKLRDANNSSNNMVIISNSHEFIQAFEEKIQALRKSLDVDIGVDVDELIDELKKIDSIVPVIKELAQAIDSVEVPELPPIPSSIEVKGLKEVGETIDKQNNLLKTIDIPKKIDLNGLSELEKTLSRLSTYVKENTDKTANNSSFEVKNLDIVTNKLDELVKTINSTAYKASQSVEEYIPTRRVRLIGNRLIFDDDAWSGGGGGGGSAIQDNLIINDALKVVNPDGTNISGGGGGSGNGAILDGSNSTIKASVLDYTNSNPLAVRLTDTSGDYVGAGAGTQYTDGNATPTHPTGTIAVFNDGGTITAVSDTSPLPVLASIDTTGLATSAKQDTGNASLASIDGKITAVNTGAVVVSSSALPSGAATAAKQPALGTAGTASSDVITVQGITSMTAIKTDGSGVTQPVSGSVTANAGTNLNTSALALDAHLTDKSQFTKITDGTDTALITAAGEQNVIATAQPGVDIGDVTINNASGASAVNIQDGGNSLTVDNGGTFAVQAAQSGTWNITNVSGTVSLPTGASTAAKQPALGTAGSASGDVITVQGIASMTALKVDGSAVTQPVSGTVTSTPEKASSVTISRVATSTTSATLISSNSSRKKAVIVNDSTSILYVKYGTTASATSYTYKLQSDDTLEETNYTGRIDGILDTGTGNAQTTDI